MDSRGGSATTTAGYSASSTDREEPSHTRKPSQGGRDAKHSRYSTGSPGPIRRELGTELITMLEDLCRPSTVAGISILAGDLLIMAGAALASYLLANIGVIILASVYIGLRQRCISNLIHECSHLKLVRPSALNRALGHFAAIILIQSFEDYQDEHRDHHALLGRDGDPKLMSYVSRGATTPRRDKWEFIFRVIVSNAILAFPAQTVRGWFSKHPEERWTLVVVRAGFWTAVLVISAVTRTAGFVCVYWLLPLALVRPAVNWLTDLGNHAGLLEDADPVRQTRGWSSHAWTRHLLGGHLDDMYHPVHHWCPKIPFRALPQAARIIRRHYLRSDEIPWCSGFFFRRHKTPGIPCVIEDIVARLRGS